MTDQSTLDRRRAKKISDKLSGRKQSAEHVQKRADSIRKTLAKRSSKVSESTLDAIRGRREADASEIAKACLGGCCATPTLSRQIIASIVDALNAERADIAVLLSLVDRLTKLCDLAGVPKGAYLIDFNATLTPEMVAHGKSLEASARKALEDSR